MEVVVGKYWPAFGFSPSSLKLTVGYRRNRVYLTKAISSGNIQILHQTTPILIQILPCSFYSFSFAIIITSLMNIKLSIMIKTLKLHLYGILCFLFLLTANSVFGIGIDTPLIKAGTAKLTGTITMPDGIKKDSIFVNISIPYPISGEQGRYKVLVNPSGKFAIDVKVEMFSSFVGFYTSVDPYQTLLVKLTSDSVTHIDISYSSANSISNIQVKPTMNKNDVIEGIALIGKMIEFRPNRAPKVLYDKSTDDFLNHAKTSIAERLTIVDNEPSISKELKELLSKDFRLFMYSGHVFDYEGEMMLNYRNTGDTSKKPNIQKIDRSYFRFLRNFRLHDPQYTLAFSFPEFQKQILQNETLAIPQIGESDIPTWLVSVKAILSDLLGFNDGLYYDILAANAYARQLNEEVKPLTAKQKENITNYWNKGEIAKILFRKNEQVLEFDKFKSPTVVNDVSAVPANKVMETIIAKYPNKVVLIDLWATWCAPCLDAMQEFRTTKNELKAKDIVFVYLTNSSSPQKLWEEKIKGIGSEHYYLNNEQWKYMMNHFELEYIPSYLLYNKKGVLSTKFSAFPGSEKVKNLINSLL